MARPLQAHLGREDTQQLLRLQLLPLPPPTLLLQLFFRPLRGSEGGQSLLTLDHALPFALGQPSPSSRELDGHLWSLEQRPRAPGTSLARLAEGRPGSRPREGPFPSRPLPRVSSEGGNAGHVPGWGTQAPLCPHTQEKTTPLPFAPPPPAPPKSLPRPTGPILVRSSLFSSPSTNIPHTQGPHSGNLVSIEGSVSPRGQDMARQWTG